MKYTQVNLIETNMAVMELDDGDDNDMKDIGSKIVLFVGTPRKG